MHFHPNLRCFLGLTKSSTIKRESSFKLVACETANFGVNVILLKKLKRGKL